MASSTYVLDFSQNTTQDTSISWESEDTADPSVKLAYLYINPWTVSVTVATSNTSATVNYQGSFSQNVTEDVEIVEGKGNVSKPSFAVISYSYGDNIGLGAVTIASDGEVTTATKGSSIVTITYTTKRHSYRVSCEEGKVQLIATVAV